MLLRSSGVRRVLVGSVSSLALAFWAHTAAANPMDGVVEAGSAGISAPSLGTLVINQTSDKAIINWGSFDVGLGERTQFVLPNHTSVTLNRDFSGDPSEILGSVTSNGRFYLVNPNGILFGQDARVDVAGLVATTHDIRSSDFLADRLDFSMAGEPGASVINQGQIRVDDLGFGAFVAPHVRNDGAIVAHMGKVELASASGFTLDLRGDSLISFLVENPNQYGILDANGQPVSALVENTGSITADGGQVVLRAAAARGVVDSVINTDGIIQANTVEQRGGKIVLGGGGAGSVKVKGTVTARGNKAGERGGEIIVTGTLLTAEQTAMLDASGWAGGGKILFGGDYLGGKATNEDVAKFRFVMEDEAIQTSSAVLLEEGAQLKADALVDGNGGKVVVWSDNLTSTAADISARGGSSGGDGGFIETSSAGVLDVRTAADTSASHGQSGTWLLDPLNITIDDPASANSRWQLTADDLFSFFPAGVFLADVFRPSSTGSVLSSAIIEDALNDGTNVVVTTRDTVGSGEGNIRVSTGITKVSGGDARLSLIASNDVIIDAGVEVLSFSGKLDVELNAETGSIIGTNLGDSFLAGGALLMLARDGIQFSTSSIMPENFYLVVNNVSTAFNQVDIAFGLDRIRFGYNASNLELGAGAITLIEDMATGNASFIGFARPVNVHLADRAIVGITDPMSFPRIWSIDNTRSWSAVNRNALNGIPEIEGFSGVSLSFGAEPGPGYTAVVEVSDLRDGTTDSRIVTAPTGFDALRNFTPRPVPIPGLDNLLRQALYPNIDLDSAMRDVSQLPGLSCVGTLQCQLVATSNPTAAPQSSSTPPRANLSVDAILASLNLGPTRRYATGIGEEFSAILDSLKLNADYQVTPASYQPGDGSSGGSGGPGFIYEAGTPYDLQGECVALVVALTSVNYPTSNWVQGENVNLGNLTPGTVVATFSPSGKYNGQHTGIFVSYIYSSSGNPIGMYMLDQNNSPGTTKPAGVRYYTFGSTQYYAVK